MVDTVVGDSIFVMFLMLTLYVLSVVKTYASLSIIAVSIKFGLVMPFVSPFGHIVQDVAAQSPFGPFEPATSPSFIIEPNAQEFGIKSDLVHSPAGYFGITKPNFIDTAIIDNDAYVLTTDSTYNVNIRNITNIESPTTVSTIPSYNAYANYLDTVVIDGSTYVVGVGSSDNHRISVTDISDTKNPASFDGPTVKTPIKTTVGLQVVDTVLINQSAYAVVGDYHGGIYIMNITSRNDITITHYIADRSDDSTSEYTYLFRVSALSTFTIDESTYVVAADQYNPDGMTIIDITNPSSPSLVYNGTLGLGHVDSIHTVTVDGSIYAMATLNYPKSIVIINITDPYSPESASTIVSGDTGYTQTTIPNVIATTTFDTTTLALVTDRNNANSGIQIIDITNPYAPSPVSAITHGQDDYTHLNNARGIDIITLDGQTYALVAGQNSNGVQIIKLDYLPLVTLTSNNTNPAYAKAGDTLNVEFSTTNTINSNGIVKMLGLSTGSGFSGETFYIYGAVPSSVEIEKYANFTATVVDNAGNSLTVTESDLLSNIFVDTKRPQISLIGDADLEVFPFTEESSIPGATATDGDPNYAGNYTLTTNGNLSTTPLGSTVIFTYTAADDSAGNTGNSITRTVTVGQPNIIHFTSLNIASSSGDNFARATQSITVSIVTDGSELGNFTGNIFGKQFTSTPNGGSASFTIEATPDDPYGNATFLITLTNASGNNITLTNALITDGSYVTVEVSCQVAFTGRAVDLCHSIQ